MKLHASLGASGAHRWMNCPGSPRMEEGIPDTKSPHALQGTAAHMLAELALTDDLSPNSYLGDTFKGVEVDEEMVEGVQLFMDTVGDALTHDEVLLWVERRFSLAKLDPPAPMFGTSDVVTYDPLAKLLTVIDLKYGRGVVVEVDDNPQVLYYGLGALLEIEESFPEYKGEIHDIKLVIVQPRAMHTEGAVRSVTVSYQDLVAFAVTLLEKAAETQVEDAPLNPGDWCRWCRAAPVCPALHKQAMAVAKREFSELPSNLPPAPEKLTVTELVTVLDNADLLTDWIKSVHAHVLAMLERGEVVPGYKAVPKRAMRKWVDVEKVLEFTRNECLLLDGTVQETKLRSPAQLEKILKRYKFTLPTELWEKKSSGYNLAPDSDPRPAALIGPAADFIDHSDLEKLL